MIDQIKRIIESIPSEGAEVDYKVQDYSQDKKADFIIDIIAMLNSNEAFAKDKFIIFGIISSTKYRKGINVFTDDADYQTLLDKISPRPTICTGEIDYDGLRYGYIFVSKENRERVYEVEQEYICSNSAVYKSQSWIRKGSRNYLITQDERNKIFGDSLKMGLVRSEDSVLLGALANNKLTRSQYTNTNFQDTIIFDPRVNNGEYVLGAGLYQFSIRMYVVNNGAAHIRTCNGELIGYKDCNMSWTTLSEMSAFDTSAIDRRLEKNEICIVINRAGKKAAIQLVDAKSKSHGAGKDEIMIEYKIYESENEQ